MSEKTGIEWATSTGNPWIGCSKVSPGCKNCYAAELDANKFSRTMGGATPENPISHWGKGAPRVRTKAFWKDAIKWNREAGERIEKWKASMNGKRLPNAYPRIFPSLCDWLDDEVPIGLFLDFLLLMFKTQNLDWLNLTKRPQLFKTRIYAALDVITDGTGSNAEFWQWIVDWIGGKPPSNVWIGVSVEDQKRADERIPQLLQIPAKVRFLSVEPLLSPIDFGLFLHAKFGRLDENFKEVEPPHKKINWVIGGLESGKDRRDSANGVNDLIDIAKQSVAAGIPFFCKQDCAFKPGQKGRIPNEIWKLKQFPNVPYAEPRKRR